MKVLIACEESQEVCKAFREKGHEAYSCDLQKCSGGHPEWHINYSCSQILWGGVRVLNPGRRATLHRRNMGSDYCTSALHIFNGFRQFVV